MILTYLFVYTQIWIYCIRMFTWTCEYIQIYTSIIRILREVAALLCRRVDNCIYIYTHAYISIYTVHIYTHLCMHIYIHTFMYIYIYICMYIYIYLCIYTSICVYMYSIYTYTSRDCSAARAHCWQMRNTFITSSSHIHLFKYEWMHTYIQIYMYIISCILVLRKIAALLEQTAKKMQNISIPS